VEKSKKHVEKGGKEDQRERNVAALFWLISGAILLYVIYRLRLVLFPFALGGMLAYALVPVARWLQNKGFRWKAAVAVVYGTTLIVVFLLFGVIVPGVIQEVQELVENLPVYTDVFLDQLKAIDDRFPQWDLTGAFRSFLTNWTYDIRDTIASALAGVIDVFVMTVGFVFLGIVVTPFVLYFFMADAFRLRHALVILFPSSRRRELVGILREIDQVVGGFIRGRILLSIFVGSTAAIGLAVLGIRFFLVIGVIAGLAEWVPYLGPIAGAIPGLILALQESTWHVLAVAVLFGSINLVEGVFLIPKVMEREMKLHPLTVLLSLLVGGAIYGAFGLIVAVPAAGVVKVLIDHYYRRPLPGLHLLRTQEKRIHH